MIRKAPDQQQQQQRETNDNVVTDNKEGDSPTPTTPTPPPTEVGSGVKEPKYNVKYRHTSDLQDAAVYQVQTQSTISAPRRKLQKARPFFHYFAKFNQSQSDPAFWS